MFRTILCFLVAILLGLSASAQNLATGVTYQGEIRYDRFHGGENFHITFTSLAGQVTGRMEWFRSGGSINSITGTYDGHNLNFSETGYIKQGKAHLNTSYALVYDPASNTFAGKWWESGKSSNVGKCWFTVSPVSSQPASIEDSWWRISTFPGNGGAGFWAFYADGRVDGYISRNDPNPAWRGQWKAQAEGVLVTMTYQGTSSQFFVQFNGDHLDGYPYEAGQIGDKYRVGTRTR